MHGSINYGKWEDLVNSLIGRRIVEWTAVLMIFAPQLFLLLAMVLGVMALLKYLSN